MISFLVINLNMCFGVGGGGLKNPHLIEMLLLSDNSIIYFKIIF